jgi:hypothetical protein
MKRFHCVMFILCVAGCVDVAEPAPEETTTDPPASSEESGTEASNPDAVYTQTIVSVTPEGRYEITHASITLAQQLAEHAVREAYRDGLSVADSSFIDPGCAGSSEWLYDQPGLVGNRICFSHPTFNCMVHDLSQFTRTTVPCPLSPFREPLPWARASGLSPSLCVVSDPVNTNRVRSIWTGSSAQPGVFFFDDQSLGGSLRSSFTGTFVQYRSVNTPGRYIQTCGARLT